MTDKAMQLADELEYLARDPMWDHYASVNVKLLRSAAAAAALRALAASEKVK